MFFCKQIKEKVYIRIMIELLNLQQQCLNLIQAYPECRQDCLLDSYCTSMGCTEGDCSRCLYQIQHGNPTFHYSCEKITYHYTLRFFNRFASEISHLLNKFNYSTLTDLNVVSLGCGPGSEVYGIIKTLLLKRANTILHYEGHDLNNYWENVQAMSKQCLEQLSHEVQFYTTDLFADFHGFTNNIINILIFNYLLSDAALFMTDVQKQRFIDDVAFFIIENNVKNILFNDINYYGDARRLNSGTQLMKLLISKLRQQDIQIDSFYYCFPGDPYRGNEGWRWHRDNRNIFRILEGNTYMDNVGCCNSKQIFVHIQ